MRLAMTEQQNEPGIVLTEEQKRRRRARSIAIALSLGVFVLLIYVVTIVKLGPGVLTGADSDAPPDATVDVFLCPVTVTPAFALDGGTPEALPFWTAPAALAGLPALAAPVGTTPAGLPVGVQIVGPLFEDDTVITFAELLAGVVGGYERPPL